MTLLLLLLVKSLLVFAAAGLTLLAMRRASASARHLVCLLTLISVLALPLVSAALPGWRVAVMQAQTRQEPTPQQVATLPKQEGAEVGTGLTPALGNAPVPQISSSFLAGRAPAKQGCGFPWPLALLALYLLGVLLASARPLLGLWGIRRLSLACADVDDAPTLAAAAGCAAALGLKRLPRLCRADVPVPMTWGGRRPIIALPLSSADWPEDRLQAVLRHEMAHVKRRDWPCHRLADVACAVYWFHPLVWLTARRLRSESEAACDDLVLSSGIAAPNYARHLLDIAAALPPASRRPPCPAAIAMAQTSQIKGRITMILDKTLTRRTVARRVLFFVLVPAAAALVPLAMLRPDAKAQTASAGPGAIQLIGITDASTPAGPAWDQMGDVLQATTFSSPFRSTEVKISALPGQKALLVAFRIPTPLQQSSRIVVNHSNGPLGRVKMTYSKGGSITMIETTDSFQSKLFGGSSIDVAGFPLSLKSADFSVGVASDAGTKTVDCPKTVGKVRLHRAAGDVIFTLLPHPQGGAVFMVSDHFRSPSPLKADNPLQVALHDGENYERSVYALDKYGKVLTKLLVTPYTWPDAMDSAAQGYHSIKTQQTAHLSSDLLRRTASFRLVARPYQWTEFKNVALHPVKP